MASSARVAVDPANRAPPSTLAAQLVEDISTSTSSSRFGDGGELSKLSAVIERVTNNPNLLQTTEQRIEHHHMLIYLISEAVLDNFRPDNPLADRERLRGNVLSAINCLRVTIGETPGVLACTAGNGEFLHRGGEPLWTWVLPKLLRLVGHPGCSEVQERLGSLCRYIIRVVWADLRLRPAMLAPLLLYLRSIVSDILDALLGSSSRVTDRSLSVSLDLPTDKTLSAVCSKQTPSRRRVTYRLESSSHALGQARTILSVLVNCFINEPPDLATAELGPWLLDSIHSLCTTQDRLKASVESEVAPLITMALNLALHSSPGTGTNALMYQKACVCLSFLLPQLAGRPSEVLGSNVRSEQARATLCNAMLALTRASIDHRPISRLVSAQVVPGCESLALLAEDLGSQTDFSRCLILLQEASAMFDVPDAFDPQSKPEAFINSELRRRVEALDLEYRQPEEASQAPRAKKRKLPSSSGTMEILFGQVSEILKPEESEADGLKDLLNEQFPQLDDHQQCHLIDLISRGPCAADGTLQTDVSDKDGPPMFSCSFCDYFKIENLPPRCLNLEAKTEAYASLENLVRLPAFRESKRPRIIAMMALRRFAKHSVDPDFLDMEVSKPAFWCFQSLSSSIRELRIAAGRTLPLFLRNIETVVSSSLPRERASAITYVISRNVGNVLKEFKTLSDKAATSQHETCIMAWGQLGRALSDQELNLVLSELIEYLGSQNNIVSALAFHEITKIAQARRVTPQRLFSPFWRSLALKVVKDVKERPYITHTIADLLQIPAHDLLKQVQSHALPWLVLQGKKDVIQKIAEARGENDLHSVILDPDNIGPILGFLMMQAVDKVDDFALSKLTAISSHFVDEPVSELLRSALAGAALEIFKIAAEGDETRKQMARNTLTEVARIVGIPGESRPKKGNMIGRFLEPHVLGLLTQVNDVISAVTFGRPATLEHRLYLQAVEEMIRVCKVHARIARPQISACLLATVPLPELRQWSLSCWYTMIISFDDEDVDVLLDTTFFLILEYWAVSNEASRKIMESMMQHIFETRTHVMANSHYKVPLLSKVPDLQRYEDMLADLRKPVDSSLAFGLFAERLGHEHSGVVLLTLSELIAYLKDHQEYLQTSAISEHPDPVVSQLLRAVLDCASRHHGVNIDVARLCTEAIGLIGCVDPNRIDAARVPKKVVLVDNFEIEDDRQQFGFFVLAEVLVKSFLAATDTGWQGVLSFAMQELLERCDIKAAVLQVDGGRRGGINTDLFRKWRELPVTVQEVLSPFLSSRYALKPMRQMKVEYPVFRPGMTYAVWLRTFVLHLLRNPQNANAALVFEPLCRVIRAKDLSIAEFLLPYAVLHIILSDSTPKQLQQDVSGELSVILDYELPSSATPAEKHEMKLFYEALFRTLDYIMRWMQQRRNRSRSEDHLPHRERILIDRARAVLERTPAKRVAERAVNCEQYPRALFNLEYEWARTPVEQTDARESLVKMMQDVYAHIDEPDGLEGLSAQLKVVDIEQQMVIHRTAGRWTVAQTWYEMRIATEPDNVDVQHDLLTCLKQSGQHDVLLNTVAGMELQPDRWTVIIPFAVEAAWATGRWDALAKYLDIFKNSSSSTPDFDVAVGEVFRDLKQADGAKTAAAIKGIREQLAASLGVSETSSLQTCHDIMLRCHVLTDLEMILSARGDDEMAAGKTMKALTRRLGVVGAYVDEKQYLLSIQRAAMELRRCNFSNLDISGLWLASAQLARKKDATHQSFNAVLHASRLGDETATLQNAKLLWKDGHSRKAIQMLEGALKSTNFAVPPGESMHSTASRSGTPTPQQLLVARTELLLAKWLDAAGQTNVATVRDKYQKVPRTCPSWEKGHYYLGKHYKTCIETEMLLKEDDQSDAYLTGELGKLMIENYLRALHQGTKYLSQTLPRIITQWLELAAQVNKVPEGKKGIGKKLFDRRLDILNKLHVVIDKWITRIPAYIWYTALPQVVARVTHPNVTAFERLAAIIQKVVEAHPRHALWHVFGIIATRQSAERRARGQNILQRLKNMPRKVEGTKLVMRDFIRRGEKLSEQLLAACHNGEFTPNRTVKGSISRDLRFNHSVCTPSFLVVPTEQHLSAQLPALTDNSRKHKAFPRDVVTLQSFLDDVLVLGSLARPRRLTARGSDGKNYNLLVKPKDDLRSDQRLMEFNAMINRGLKRDAESARRRLYVRTYAVTPLNEECGIIEWVDGLKTLRDIIGDLHRARGVQYNYPAITKLLEDLKANDFKNVDKVFYGDILGAYPPVLHHWFVDQFPDPTSWFHARLQYARSCAVMSMVGTLLGLGDRHAENVLLEEYNGGVFHVDFNCLFDKGQTFGTPERVPFRLTHNMTTAMGVCGVEGPFRTCCELTLSVVRQQEETLMTVLEAFVYDPTLDLQKDKKTTRKNDLAGLKFHPQNVVDAIKRKIRGYIGEDNRPLGVEGQVEELISQATDARNLAAMYVGWCSFL